MALSRLAAVKKLSSAIRGLAAPRTPTHLFSTTTSQASQTPKDLKPAPECCRDISGRWYNELGSHVDFKVEKDGKITGKYWTKVELETDETGLISNDLVGFYPLATKKDAGPTFAFVVSWGEGQSTTAWNGECFEGNDGSPVLRTNWLLQTRQEKEHYWEGCRIGFDIFTRNKQE